jgi:phage repressor protein C with HTH and peptisase S24 domain
MAGKDRVLALLNTEGVMSPQEIAERLHLNRSSVRSYLGILFTEGKVEKLGYGSYRAMADVSKEKNPETDAGTLLTGYRIDREDGLVYVPLVRPLVSAGTGALTYEEGVERYLVYMLDRIRQDLGFLPSEMVAFRVTGNSMEPSLHAGELVLVAMGAIDLLVGSVYLIRSGPGLMIKRLKAVSSTGSTFCSDNSFYPDLTLTPTDSQEEVQVMGKVLKVDKNV